MGRLVRGQEARASGMGTWVEGLAALWRVSEGRAAFGRARADQGRALCASGILAERQIDELGAGTYARPEMARGGWFRSG